MFNFRDITLEDRNPVNGYLEKSNFMGSEYAFASLFMWRKTQGTKIAEYENWLVILKRFRNRDYYLYPAGNGDLKTVIEAIIADADGSGRNPRIAGITKTGVEALEKLFPGRFKFVANRDVFDYIYDAQSLINLKGRDYHAKRNYINRFISRYGNISYEEIDKSNTEECKAAYVKWLANKDPNTPGLEEEHNAIDDCFRYYEKMGLYGGLVRVKDRVCSFSFGSRINTETVGIHIEKSLIECEGGYAVINREFAAKHAAGYRYINREEDLGLEGLRKAKLSYKPVFLLEKHTAVPKKQDKI